MTDRTYTFTQNTDDIDEVPPTMHSQPHSHNSDRDLTSSSTPPPSSAPSQHEHTTSPSTPPCCSCTRVCDIGNCPCNLSDPFKPCVNCKPLARDRCSVPTSVVEGKRTRSATDRLMQPHTPAKQHTPSTRDIPVATHARRKIDYPVAAAAASSSLSSSSTRTNNTPTKHKQTAHSGIDDTMTWINSLVNGCDGSSQQPIEITKGQLTRMQQHIQDVMKKSDRATKQAARECDKRQHAQKKVNEMNNTRSTPSKRQAESSTAAAAISEPNKKPRHDTSHPPASPSSSLTATQHPSTLPKSLVISGIGLEQAGVTMHTMRSNIIPLITGLLMNATLAGGEPIIRQSDDITNLSPIHASNLQTYAGRFTQWKLDFISAESADTILRRYNEVKIATHRTPYQVTIRPFLTTHHTARPAVPPQLHPQQYFTPAAAASLTYPRPGNTLTITRNTADIESGGLGSYGQEDHGLFSLHHSTPAPTTHTIPTRQIFAPTPHTMTLPVAPIHRYPIMHQQQYLSHVSPYSQYPHPAYYSYLPSSYTPNMTHHSQFLYPPHPPRF